MSSLNSFDLGVMKTGVRSVVELMSQISLAIHQSHDCLCSALTNWKDKCTSSVSTSIVNFDIKRHSTLLQYSTSFDKY